MNKNTFERVVEDTLGMAQKVLTRKSGEYSSSDDKLHNFDKAKDLMRCKTKEFALLGMLNKHLVSVIDMIEKFEKTGELPTSNMIDEKIGDSINYFILLKACFYDDMIKAEAEKVCKCDCEREDKKDDKIKDYPERAMSLTEILKQNEGAIANSMYQNPRKRLVVEELRKMLKPIFVYLTENNMFREYEIIKGICNREEMKQDDIGDNEFYKNIVIALEKLQSEFSADMRSVSDEIISRFAQGLSKFNVGDMVICIAPLAWNNKWEVCEWWRIQRICVGIENREIYYYSKSSVGTKEKDCFATKEEAEKECERRNKKIEKGSAKE